MGSSCRRWLVMRRQEGLLLPPLLLLLGSQDGECLALAPACR